MLYEIQETQTVLATVCGTQGQSRNTRALCILDYKQNQHLTTCKHILI